MKVNQERARRVVINLTAAMVMTGALIASVPAVAGHCNLHKFAEFPVTMTGPRALMTAKINDIDVQLTVDSGAFYSTLSEASAAQLKLKTALTPLGFYVSGAHGSASVSSTIVDTFAVPGSVLHNIEFLVAGGETGYGSVGLLGQNFLHIADVEYDLGQGLVRLIRPEDCSKTVMAYWAPDASPYSVIELQQEPSFARSGTGTRIPPKQLQLSHTIGRAYVNGVGINVMFDTGAGVSLLSTRAAARAGIKPDSPGAVNAGLSSGIGKETFATYIVPVSSFKIGDEEIKNTRLRIGDLEIENVDMLVGADFFLSHHIYVANSQKKLYFTYNGGPVFNLTTANRPAGSAEAAPAAPTPTEDAADFARRGAALASRQDFDQALIALSRACELAPENPSYAFQRGTVYWQLKQPAAAKAEYDRALLLKPDYVEALVMRAQFTAQTGDKTAAATDLEAADAAAPKTADIRLQMANAYQRVDRLPGAIQQLTLWIDSHSVDARMPEALNERCWLRALANVDLPLALKDCDAALKRVDKSSTAYAHFTDSRGFLFLRMQDYDHSIADYDVSLKINPKSAWSLYGRGIDKLRKHETAAGNADIANAVSLSPKIADAYLQRGISP